jgi:hypothetical protein
MKEVVKVRKRKKNLKRKKRKKRKNLVKNLKVLNQREMVGKRTNRHFVAAALAYAVISTQRTQTAVAVQSK